MLHLLVGHRGVGKSTLLQRLAVYYERRGWPVATFDLDRVISERTGESASELFQRRGEAAFRELECSTLRDLLLAVGSSCDRPSAAGGDTLIALGAGFCGELPKGAKVTWVRRPTDGDGRIFAGSASAKERPRLDATVDPLREYLQRFPSREQRYRSSCWQQWCLPEGLDLAVPGDGDIDPYAGEEERVLSLLATPTAAPARPVGGVLSLLPIHFQGGQAAWQDFIGRRIAWPATRFELRDDLLNDEQLARAKAAVPPERRIYSLRRSQPSAEAAIGAQRQAAAEGAQWDYPLEFGRAAAPTEPPILSLHERQPGESLAAAAERLKTAGAELSAKLLKLAVEVSSLAELEVGWLWAAAAPMKRVFLPRSNNRAAPAEAGRWRWFRLLSGRTAPLAFIREGDGTGLDQPLLAEWWAAQALGSQRFAAVLGAPVGHSRTPIEHQSFFAARHMPVVAIELSEAEWQSGGLAILQRLGLRYAAVTAPLKRVAAALVGQGGDAPTSINTLYFCERSQAWRGTNTDPIGARALLGSLRDEPAVAVWGGGGTLPALTEALPNARYFSARSGLPQRDGGGMTAAAFRPRTLVWAVGRSRLEATTWPDPSWRPELVVDLNYSDESPGREYAQRIAARYLSGLAMFQAQAAAQRQFWSQSERTSAGVC